MAAQRDAAPSIHPPAPPRERILATAARLFQRDGIPGTGVDRLIDEAGVAKATFYRHFASKDDLVVAWLRSAEARWIDEVAGAIDHSLPPIEQIDRFWSVVADWQERHDCAGCPYLNTLVEIRDPDGPALGEVASYIGEVEAWFSSAAAAGGIPEPETVGRRLRILLMGALMAVRFAGTPEPLDVARRTALDVLTRSSRRSRDPRKPIVATA